MRIGPLLSAVLSRAVSGSRTGFLSSALDQIDRDEPEGAASTDVPREACQSTVGYFVRTTKPTITSPVYQTATSKRFDALANAS